MGFGPQAPDVESGVRAVKDLIELLYPDRATTSALALFGETARALLSAKAPLTFENVDRFWKDPEWREWIMGRWPEALPGPWEGHGGSAVDPADLDQDFAWLIQDRIQAGHGFHEASDGAED